MFLLKLVGFLVVGMAILAAGAWVVREVLLYVRIRRFFEYLDLDEVSIQRRMEADDEDGLGRDIAEALRAKNILLLFKTERRLRELVDKHPNVAVALEATTYVRQQVEMTSADDAEFSAFVAPPELVPYLGPIAREWTEFDAATDLFFTMMGYGHSCDDCTAHEEGA